MNLHLKQMFKEAVVTQIANKLILKSLIPELLKYDQIKRWNGEFPKTLLGKEGTFLLVKQKN